MVTTDVPELLVDDVAAWRGWLDVNEDSHDGVWLVLAKKGTVDPTRLTYAEALDEALCSGWIDGQKRSRDAATFLQRFTPRRRASMWSARNVEHVARLVSEGRMRARGTGEVDRARADGRWDRAYPGSATIEVPADLAAALKDSPGAAAAFGRLNRQERYSVLHPVVSASTDDLRAARIRVQVARLAERAQQPDA
ncbi:YdeI/OmpD-associated family protein [Paraoerskovia marina]|uniref:YdeI/OmpD-associated family protein n=1 Tax=Paraoerskovia marina TaxID=545619 RepID=UPI000492B3D3|nr:YdeI/OmpD-associated family protein [Paraoerskovia marina]